MCAHGKRSVNMYVLHIYVGDSHIAFWEPKPGSQLTQPLGFDKWVKDFKGTEGETRITAFSCTIHSAVWLPYSTDLISHGHIKHSHSVHRPWLKKSPRTPWLLTTNIEHYINSMNRWNVCITSPSFSCNGKWVSSYL